MISNPNGRRTVAIFIFALASSTVCFPEIAFACPLGSRETRLEISRVMRNFGRFLLKAEQAANDGIQRPQSVTDQQITAAIEGIQVAQSCARAALEARSDELLPAKAGQLQGAERERYLEKYRSHMAEFASSLDDFKSLFEGLLKTEKDRRDFGAANIKRAEIRERANKAHGEL